MTSHTPPSHQKTLPSMLLSRSTIYGRGVMLEKLPSASRLTPARSIALSRASFAAPFLRGLELLELRHNLPRVQLYQRYFCRRRLEVTAMRSLH